jgi:DNA-binding XRE family transcriptional regulator
MLGSSTPFSTQVRMARAGLAWSQDDLASRSGVSARTIKYVEADRRKPRSGTRAKISDALANAGADLDGDCSVRIRGEARSTPSAVVETSSECRP